MARRVRPDPEARPSFVSTQVTEARRYFLDLDPKPARELVVVCGGCERLRPEYLVQRETFPFLAIEFVAEGEGALELNGRSYRLRPGMAFAYGPGVPHCIRNESSRPMLKYYVDFAGAAGRALLAQTPLLPWCALQLSSRHEIAHLFELLQREGASASRFGPQLCAALLPALILKIADCAVPYGEAEPRALQTFERARRYVEERFVALRSAEEAAAGCHLDVAYLTRLFQRFAHTTPYRYLMKLKMSRAAELLLDERLLVKEAAAELKFADPFHFSRAFKRVYGVSPERFIRQRRSM